MVTKHSREMVCTLFLKNFFKSYLLMSKDGFGSSIKGLLPHFGKSYFTNDKEDFLNSNQFSVSLSDLAFFVQQKIDYFRHLIRTFVDEVAFVDVE